ncbi:MAG: ChbG/HpnK family deacetylase [Erysipelotrichaceae bacterium]|nr:ChbG/HpnK family deacetylase [Erysipelotrichaceae bacterium]
MTRIIFNADDFGYSEAVSLGIIKAHYDGLIKSTTMMTNMESAAFAAQLAKKYPSLYVGQHSNIVVGKPCSNPKDIPSLVDTNGFFNTKQRQNAGLKLDREDIRKEIRTQAERFKELMGHYPTHIEGHAIRDRGLFWAIKEVALELKIHFTDIENDLAGQSLRNQYKIGYEIPVYPDTMYYMENVDLKYWTDDWGNLLQKELVEMHTHPGFIDQYLLDHSTYNLPRAKEVSIACDVRVKEWAAANGVEFITFEDLRKL